MSLYYVQKFLYELNRDPDVQANYARDRHASLESFDLTDEEIRALTEPDIGLLFHLGVNGQILMHFAALHKIEWADYLQRMRDGIERHGPVREGVYAITGYEGTDAHAESLGQGAGTGSRGVERSEATMPASTDLDRKSGGQ